MQKINIEKLKNMPLNYQNCLMYIIKCAENIYKENLISIFLAGSGGKEKLIDKWSDLDLYIICIDFDIKANYQLYTKIKDNDYNIHVGLTFYTKEMVNNLNVDSKTLVAFYEYTNLSSNYFVYNSMEINKVNLEDITYQKREINDIIQVVNRELYNYILTKNNFKTLIKKLTLLVKVYLIKKHKILVYGYNNVFKEINKVFNIKNNINIEEIIKNKKINELELDYFSSIINLIMKGIF